MGFEKFKHLVFGNDRPQLRVVDVAIRARIHLVPFKADFTGKNRDPEMAAKLRLEQELAVLETKRLAELDDEEALLALLL